MNKIRNAKDSLKNQGLRYFYAKKRRYINMKNIYLSKN